MKLQEEPILLPLKKSPRKDEEEKYVRVILPINLNKVPNISSLIPFDSKYQKYRENYVNHALKVPKKKSKSPPKKMDIILAHKIAKLD